MVEVKGCEDADKKRTLLCASDKIGEEGIRTLDTIADIPVFETGRFNHSRTSP